MPYKENCFLVLHQLFTTQNAKTKKYFVFIFKIRYGKLTGKRMNVWALPNHRGTDVWRNKCTSNEPSV